MAKTPIPGSKSVVLFLALVLFTVANYGCQSSTPTTDKSLSQTAAQSPTPVTIPPWPSAFPPSVPPAAISGNLLYAVPLPQQIDSPLQIRPNFDYFSWQSFIALNWPAATGSRGVPDQPGNPSVFLNARSGTPVVWGTYKDTFDLFGQQNQRPSPWDSPSSPIVPCSNAQTGQKVLMFTTKGQTPLMQTNQAFSFPLIDQRSNLAYYDIRYNQAQYNFIRGQDSDPTSWLYLLKNLAPKENAQYGVQMPMTSANPNVLGSIMVKAAWRIKTDKDDPSRYYTVAAQIYNAQTKSCTPTTVMLVGLHIAHKVSPFTEWVWSTFEQVDNVPPDSDISPKPAPPPNGYSFNNGTDTPKTVNGYSYKPALSPTPCPSPGDPSKPCPLPVQVTRVNAIPNTPTGASTRDFNAYYQQLLKGTVWQYYQLVVTQWPFNPGIGDGAPFKLMQNQGVYPLNAGAAFPVYGAVNTSMETYFQGQSDAAGAGGNSCMSCHYRAGQSDFSWGLNRRAH
ncbi:MAG: hypothetical protein JST85_00935 [Acidobacteria bacterium]|nr:hypothetical protein [Acidobacteriota bacterium]